MFMVEWFLAFLLLVGRLAINTPTPVSITFPAMKVADSGEMLVQGVGNVVPLSLMLFEIK